MTIVKFEDQRRAGVCDKSRHWFARHGLDFRDYVRNGIDSEKLLAVGCSRDAILRMIKAAEEREAREERTNG